jgi:gliding motility-associated-like protein
MIKRLLYIIILVASLPLFAQKEAANWYFGYNAGVSFNSGTPLALTDGQLSQLEGCATISDPNGNLLFYTNGIEIYNANHVTMVNGTGLLGNQSSSQSAIIVPAPGDPDKYFVFAVDAQGGGSGLTYSVVDMALDSGLGGVTTEKNIALATSVEEKITAVFHENGEDIWVMSHRLNSNQFIAYKLTAAGINTIPVVSAIGVNNAFETGIGYMKASPDGKKVVIANLGSNAGVQLFDFNSATGQISNLIKLNNYTSYGVEFSPDSKIVYSTSTLLFNSPIYQYNITLGTVAAIQASQTVIASQPLYSALQLAIDGKIYVAKVDETSLGVINNPNVLGTACNFVDTAVNLSGNSCSLGLPPFIQNYFQFELGFKDLCAGQPTQMEIVTRSTIATASWNFGDPGSGVNNISSAIQPGHTYSTPGTYTVTVSFTTDVGYSMALTDTVTILASPAANTAADLVLCDTLPNDGFAQFTLSLQTGTILGTQNPVSYAVTYHTTQTDAIANANPLPASFTNTSSLQAIYARVTNTVTGCYAISTFRLIVNPVPLITDPDDLIACEAQQGQGVAVFDLTQAIPQITNGNPSLAVTFYKTLSGPGNNLPIASPSAYSNTTAYSETVYFKVADPAAPDCTATGDLQLIINPIPNLNNNIPDYILCDENTPGDGIEAFDLTTRYSALTATPGLALSYFYEQGGQLVPITSPAAFTNTIPGGQVIFVTTENVYICGNVTHFTIKVVPLPSVPMAATFHACEDTPGFGSFILEDINAELSNGQPNLSISYYATAAQAQAEGTTLPSPYLSANGSIYAVVRNMLTACTVNMEVILDVIPAPIAAQPAPIAECDGNNDGFAEFDLVPSMQAIEAALADVTVTAHETPQDAEFGVNAIPNPGTYLNVNANGQTLYLRVKADLTECFDIVTLQLIVNPTPEATTPSDYELCDDGASDTDGESIFNLSTKAGEIYGTIDPAQFSLAFYETMAAANAGTPQIPNPLSYLSGTATVYAKVTNNATGCFDIVALNLVVNPLPVLLINEYVYRLCETEDPVEIETFDLTSTIPVFLLDQDGIEVMYYHTFADANAHTNNITNDTAYQNTSPGAETLFVRFTIEATGCYRIGFLDVDVDPEPIILPPTTDELTVCDTNGQLIGEFDLAALVPGMINGEPGLVLTFHETQLDAINGTNAIPNTSNYITSNPSGVQTVWVRVENTITGCVNNEPYMLTLHVEPAPQAPSLEDLTYCDDTDNNGQDGRKQVDLTVQNAVISAALGLDIPTELIVEYYTTAAAAEAGTGRIITPAAFMGTDGQQIWVRVEAPVTGCYSVESFFLRFGKPHALTTPAVFAKCNDALPNDGSVAFNLTEKDNEILGPSGVSQGYTVNYYETDPKLPGATPIANPTAYSNAGPPVVNPKTLYVEVITLEGCKSYTTLTLKVLALPVPNFTPEALQLCDDTAPAGTEPFDLTLAADDIKANGSNYILSYYATAADAEAATNAIANPAAYDSGSSQVFVRVELDTNNPLEPKCHQVVTLELILNALPPIADLDDFTRCEEDTTLSYDFDIQGYVNDALGTTGNYDVDYFTDAALNTPAVPVNAYPVTGTATVYVRVVNLDTDCQIVKELELRVEQSAFAYPVTQLAVECDYFGANDGITNTWDLTQVEAEVLGTQDPNVYIVTYHDTNFADAELGLNPIANPQAYTNQVPIQTIWITVTNSATQKPCRAVAEMTIITQLIPVPVITGGTICVDKSTDAVVRPLLIDTGLDGAAHTFQWFHDNAPMPAESGPSILAQEEGSYTVIATSNQGSCVSDLAGPAVVTKSGPAVKLGRGYYVTNYFSDNQTITVTVDGYGVYEYSLDEGPWQSSNIFTNVSPGSHTVTVRDTNAGACDELVITDASIVDYPNFFTPNGDGFHDTWNIIGLANTGSVIYIFDRYGKLLKQISPDQGGGWDGTFNGVAVPADDYWFSVTYPEFNGTTTVTREFKSHFSIKR